MQTQQAEVKRTATQRLEDLENMMMNMFHTADNMARDIITLKEAVKLLGNKVDSIVTLLSTGKEVSDDTVADIMMENNSKELKSKVDGLVEQGILVLSDGIVGTRSFVVGRELDDTGQVVNPRIQFALSALPENLQSKVVGSKAGDVVTLEEGKLNLEVLEVYSIETPSLVRAEAVEAAETETAKAETADTTEATAEAE